MIFRAHEKKVLANGGIDANMVMPILAILDRSPSMLAYWDAGLVCRYANKAYHTWFGVEGDQLTGTTLRDLLGLKLFTLNEPFIRAALRGEPQHFQRRIEHGGVARHGLASYLPHVVNGKVMGFVAEVNDVTELHEAHRALQDEMVQRNVARDRLRVSEAALRQAQKLANLGSWEWEIEPDIVTWSEQLYQIFGRDPSQLPPSFLEHPDIYTKQSWNKLRAAVTHTLETGEAYVLELEYIHASGRHGWLEARGEARWNRDQTIVVAINGTAMDITYRRDAALQGVSMSGYAGLTEDLQQLREQNADLEHALEIALEQRKVEFTGRVKALVRDLKNLVGIISGVFQRIGSVADAPRTRDLITLGQQSTERGKKITEEILAISMAGRSSQTLVDVQLALGSASHLLQCAIGARNTLVIDSMPGLYISANQEDLKMTLIRLVVNACEAMPDGGEVRITTSTNANLKKYENKPPAEKLVVIKVSTAGNSMGSTFIEKFRSQFASGVKDGQTTAPGMVRVRAFVQECNGFILLSGNAEEGMTVTLLIPMQIQHLQ
ncbi:MAG: PAS domain-containing protein [Pseudomonadota bacterium]